MQVALSTNLTEITAEINIWKQQAGQAVFEIGKRLKHVKENDLVHGEWIPWLESVDITPRTAQRMIQAFEQIGNTTHASHLPTGKIFEIISLPETVDRQKFLSDEHTIPSTGEKKTVSEMDREELREVKKALQAAEQRAAQAEATATVEKNTAQHYEKLWNQAKNQPPQVRVETKTVEIVPDSVTKEIEKLRFENTDLRHGYKEAREKIQAYEMKNTIDFDAEQSRKQREKLQHEADYNTLQLRVNITSFIEKVAINSYMTGAIAASDPITKKKLQEGIDMLEEFTNQIKAALKGRILGGIVNE